MANLITWYRSQKPLVKSLMGAVLFVLPVLGSALVSYYLKLSLDTVFQIQLVAVVVLFVVFALVRRYIEPELCT